MAEEKQAKNKIVLEERNKITILGVTDVFAFDEDNIILETNLGVLTVSGANLHINKLNLENAELEVDGEIDGVIYNQSKEYMKSQGGLLSKLFK